MTKFLEYFKLQTSFTKNDLDKAYDKKIKEIDQLNISKIDKEFYKQTTGDLYIKANNYIIRNNQNKSIFENMFSTSIMSSSNNNQTNMYSYQEISSSKLNPDGSISVYKKSLKNNNGDIVNNEEKYTKYKDGKIEYHNNPKKIDDKKK
jgi:hypothetical protein